MSLGSYRIDEKPAEPILEPFLMRCGLCKENGVYVVREFTNRDEYYKHKH